MLKISLANCDKLLSLPAQRVYSSSPVDFDEFQVVSLGWTEPELFFVLRDFFLHVETQYLLVGFVSKGNHSWPKIQGETVMGVDGPK